MNKIQPSISNEVRKRLGEAAVKAAGAVNYVGAGKSFCFLLSSCVFQNIRLNGTLR